MFSLKHVLIISVFGLFLACVMLFAFITADDSVEFTFNTGGGDYSDDSLQDQSFFSNSQLYLLQDNRPSLFIDSDELVINQRSQRTLFLRPRGQAFTSSGEAIDYRGERGHFLETQQKLYLIDQVMINNENSEVEADRVIYDLAANKIDSTGNVKTRNFNPQTRDRIRVDADRVISWPERRQSEYSGNVDGRIDRHRAYEDSVEFETERLFMDLDQQLITLNNDVILRKQGVTAESLRGEIYLENYNKTLKYFVLYDDVKLEEKVMLRGDSYVRKAFAEKLEGLMSEEQIILTGYPKVHQRNDVIKGNRIVLRENNEVIEVDDAQSQFIVR